MPKKPPMGMKTRLYPHGYGFCQCGCGQRTTPSRDGVHPLYTSKKPSGPDPTEAFVQEVHSRYQNALLDVEAVADEVRVFKNFMNDYWVSTPSEKKLAVAKLNRILDGLKILSSRSIASRPITPTDEIEEL